MRSRFKNLVAASIPAAIVAGGVQHAAGDEVQSVAAQAIAQAAARPPVAQPAAPPQPMPAADLPMIIHGLRR
ncbi:MAG TPA: hypothetical protein VHM90_06910 [Phycisphaerae bacterium]|jgi:hypothetical protein|nr:hypothetical protein [Phycisphaerae bacterium]